jgi:hypothetical protein
VWILCVGCTKGTQPACSPRLPCTTRMQPSSPVHNPHAALVPRAQPACSPRLPCTTRMQPSSPVHNPHAALVSRAQPACSPRLPCTTRMQPSSPLQLQQLHALIEAHTRTYAHAARKSWLPCSPRPCRTRSFSLPALTHTCIHLHMHVYANVYAIQIYTFTQTAARQPATSSFSQLRPSALPCAHALSDFHSCARQDP